ncbi:DUF98 domain-containing protein [bacterium]|nr:MAG: DUF98 domain-containing protein [bacterium]
MVRTTRAGFMVLRSAVIMNQKLSYTIVKGWVTPGKPHDGQWWERLSVSQRLLLLSEGSMTVNLELFSGSGEKVEADVRFAGSGALDEGEALCLEEDKGKGAFEREVWLKITGKMLICARTVIPFDRIDAVLLKTLMDEDAPQPLGRILREKNMGFSKEKIELAVLTSPQVSKVLAVSANTPFAARRYVLLSKAGAAGLWNIKASIMEIFSPELIAV